MAARVGQREWRERRVREEGRAPGWRFDGDTLTTIIPTHSFRVTDVVMVTVKIKSEMARQRAMLDGFPEDGPPARNVRHFESTWPEGWTPDILY